MRKDTRVEMVDYDPVKERACFSYISSKGKPLSLWIHRTTFYKLLHGPWEQEKMGEPTLQQKELRDSIRTSIKGHYGKWFEDVANDIMKQRTLSRTNDAPYD